MNLVVDDDPLACKRLRELLVICGARKKEVAVENCPLKARERILQGDYELVFLDVDMPKLDGISLLKSLREQGHTAAVIFTTAHESFAIEALRQEALDYLLKPVDTDELRAALKRFREQSRREVKNFDKLLDMGLSRRQVEIARRIFEGKTSADIAEDLFLSKHTVDTHRRTILRKTGCRNTTELFRLL